ncbi:hypothetical protein [Thermococcus sp. 2319x1]|uniref:hypothetical protein n=1 Tax=Thermococcus sp. 2319x1 TaxID=1674923 RepID=UPI00130DDCF2|nr:hypothetical protein [Thermococcus sp. 2319x1]
MKIILPIAEKGGFSEESPQLWQDPLVFLAQVQQPAGRPKVGVTAEESFTYNDFTKNP